MNNIRSAKDDLELIKKNRTVHHNSFFNSRKKSIFESKLAQLVLSYKKLFISEINKVSQLILPDLIRLANTISDFEYSENKNSLCYKFHKHLLLSSDVRLFYKVDMDNSKVFYTKITNDLNSLAPETYYKQLAIQRVYLIFFINGGVARPELAQALQEGWSCVDLNQLFGDTLSYRGQLFINNLRTKRVFSYFKTSQNLGILAPEEYQTLDETDKTLLCCTMPEHEKGMFLYQITTKGNFTNAGMHVYDMPQLCGPSGMTAMRLALAKQAGLSSCEMQLFDFFVGFYTIAMGAHSLDEVFSIGKGRYNDYQRGNYETIIPNTIKTHDNFQELWSEIKDLYREYHFPLNDKDLVAFKL
ncbi:hypothetical protein [Legionella sp. km772]|uniref:hypothetical protein n=1 Tax=Legionella sp. km772 TaxID=2498111 RepID=UPI000F8C5627|nr:hypothetical protein [Legionella sp. km772]RUR08595.1 hypothetical protein ELY15_10505 [Legionella sp. km772]